MSTLATLVEAHGLRSLSVPMGAAVQKWRVLYAAPRLITFLGQIVAGDPPTRCEADLSPKEQLYGLFADFISGEELVFDEEYHAMYPGDAAIWELKTPDIRIYGWFAQVDCFIGVVGDWKDRIVEFGLNAGYRDEAITFRRDCGAEEKFCIWETGPHDAISVRD